MALRSGVLGNRRLPCNVLEIAQKIRCRSSRLRRAERIEESYDD
jgi:hypothetical protein